MMSLRDHSRNRHNYLLLCTLHNCLDSGRRLSIKLARRWSYPRLSQNRSMTKQREPGLCSNSTYNVTLKFFDSPLDNLYTLFYLNCYHERLGNGHLSSGPPSPNTIKIGNQNPSLTVRKQSTHQD